MTDVSTYDVGDVAKLMCNIQVADVDTDPTGLTFKIRAGGGAVTSYVYGTNSELVKANTGDYYVLWPVAVEQMHFFRFENASGTAIGAGESQFKVRDSRFY